VADRFGIRKADERAEKVAETHKGMEKT